MSETRKIPLSIQLFGVIHIQQSPFLIQSLSGLKESRKLHWNRNNLITPLHHFIGEPIVFNRQYFIDGSINDNGIYLIVLNNGKAPAKKAPVVANPIFAATPKNFHIGGDILVYL